MDSFDFSVDSAAGDNAAETGQQLYRSKASSKHALELLEREDLTKDDIVDFIQGRPVRPPANNAPQKHQQEAYRRRRKEIQSLLRKVKTDEARVDEYGRLVEVQDPTAPPAIQLPPPPPARDPPPPPNGWLEQDEEDREWVAQGERDAAAAINRQIQRWQDEGVADEDVVLVRIPRDDEHDNLTFRRICYAVLTVVGCFTAIMLQQLPLSSPSYSDPDRLLEELLQVKTIEQHLQSCPKLERTENMSQKDWLVEYFGRRLTDDCADGVLHIPSPQQMLAKMVPTRSVPAETAMNGLHASWFFDCHAVDGQGSPLDGMVANSKKTREDSPPNTCSSNAEHKGRCFRGVHDEFASGMEINMALDLGAKMILKGGDHHDVYLSDVVPPNLESIVTNIRVLLEGNYSVRSDIHPVAFRIGAEGPMDGKDVPRIGIQSVGPRPVKLLNLTNYVNYVERVGKRNGFAQFSLPWPLRVQPYRDECNLLADMQVDSRFTIHTMIFLADGAGSEFRGGEALYVDDHPSNSNPRRKIRRGLIIDGARGRLVVSTGGRENRRCRLPIRGGVRAALQIWWQSRGNHF